MKFSPETLIDKVIKDLDETSKKHKKMKEEFFDKWNKWGTPVKAR